MNYSISAKKNAYLFIISVGILNTIIALLMYGYLKSSLMESLYIKNIELAKLEFKKTEKEVTKEIEHYKHILNVIKNSDNFNEYLKEYSPIYKEHLIYDFTNFTNSNKNIFQLRFLDEKGVEKIRIDKIDGKTVTANTLQDKSKRYYFIKTKSLQNGEFYISDFDLNIENKKIEIPYKPTIRVATPIYENGNFLGILIINYNAKELIDYISDKHIFDVYYMDKLGNFLLHPDEKKSWSSQLNTNYKVKDEIKNIQELLEDKFKDKNWVYYLNKVSITDNDFYIIYSIKKSFYDHELSQLKNEVLIIFFIIFLVTLPVVLLGSYLQSFQMKILETLIDSLPFPIVLKNRKGEFVLVNNSLVKLFNASNKEDILGKNSYDFSSKHLPCTDEEKDREVLNKRKMKFEDIVILNKNKKLYFDTRLIKISFLGLFNKDFILGIAIDITELKELNNELEIKIQKEVANRINTEKQLAQKVKLAEIGNLIDNIILQWEQPLNLISLSVQAIELDSENDNFNEENTLSKLAIIKKNTNFLFNTAEDFKIFLSINKGIELFSIDEIISIVERILTGRIKNNYVVLNKNIDSTMNLKGHKSEFSQVILNLINNALDEFESPNKVFKEKIITLEAFVEDNYSVIKVKDNAGGIPQKYIDKIFENKFTLKPKESLGIGLTICKNIIEKNFKGRLSAYNEGNSAVLEIRIPI